MRMRPRPRSIVLPINPVWIAGGLAKGSRFEQLVADQAHTIKAAVIIGRDQQPMLDAFKMSAPNIPLTIIDPADNGVIMEGWSMPRASTSNPVMWC